MSINWIRCSVLLKKTHLSTRKVITLRKKYFAFLENVIKYVVMEDVFPYICYIFLMKISGKE